jgi:glutathione S-transferase
MSSSFAISEPTLFYTRGSPYARICRMAVYELGLSRKLNAVQTTLRDPQAIVLPLNPTGRVPTLALPDGSVLSETTLILQWLDAHAAQPRLFSSSAKDVAAYGLALGLLDGIAVWNRELRRKPSERSPDVLELESVRAERIADVLEVMVHKGQFSSWDAAGLALLSVIGYAERRHQVWSWRSGRPNLQHWFESMSARASFLETLPPLIDNRVNASPG